MEIIVLKLPKQDKRVSSRQMRMVRYRCRANGARRRSKAEVVVVTGPRKVARAEPRMMAPGCCSFEVETLQVNVGW